MKKYHENISWKNIKKKYHVIISWKNIIKKYNQKISWKKVESIEILRLMCKQ